MTVLALLTDFGTRDTYVAQMHGVIAARDPSLRVIDITHAIPPQDVLAGAYALNDAVEAFLPGTIFVGVVDPGVGSQRRAIAAEIGSWRFVGPDNGLITVLLHRFSLGVAVELSNPAFHRLPRSSTFHGRDIFAPVAAAWATGTPLAALGQLVTTPLVRLDHATPVLSTDEKKRRILSGVVLDADHFGNLRTNIHRDQVPSSAIGQGLVALDGVTLGPIANCYADVAPGEVLALFGSNNRLEIAVGQGPAAVRFPHARTVTIEFSFEQPKLGS